MRDPAVTGVILHASGELDRLREVALVWYLHHVSPDTLVILGENRGGVFDLGRARCRRPRVFRFFLRRYTFTTSILGRRRLVPALDNRRWLRDRLALDRLVQHAHSARVEENGMSLRPIATINSRHSVLVYVGKKLRYSHSAAVLAKLAAVSAGIRDRICRAGSFASTTFLLLVCIDAAKRQIVSRLDTRDCVELTYPVSEHQ